ncbi:outer membrane protein assembly factor BamC [Polynucleobacter sp. 30F-ANTBAC]|jgi:outer membrane protein assembly factor BamC|uniref:outer membrane protein assembly factor BamC n=1 Tax=Polynucleobacter sp. 30F-ANTBAC TaxID=2689095 RepID=UPI001C0C948C|nr:outer membrane protein assembly factor BamC [Polynucleobacter sp. 30F-ANTBAC]MBU3600702.1 outer membrane protein assembly factor BamC [Polynucleobacter sp. 30F-ANTBAC]
MRRLPSQSRLVLIGTLSLLLTACSSTFSGDTIDYKSAGEKKGPNLAFPPDMAVAGGDKRYVVPDGGATLSGYSNAVQTKPTSKEAVLPTVAGIRVERDGSRRWLVINKPAKELYPSIRDFWQETGFILMVDSPETGIMETDWAENRAKIPQDFIRRTIGKVLDSIYSTGERDKFRTRLEVNSKGETEVFITHRGATEELTGSDKNQAMWTTRANDPELEAEFLARLMQRLGYAEESTKASLAAAKTASGTTKVSNLKKTPTPRLEFAGNFDRAWREVGVGLDRSNFTVDDRDRSKGIYYVRFVNTQELSNERGFFDKMFSKKSDDDMKKAKRYRVLVKDTAGTVTVTVQDENGAAEAGGVSEQILSLLDLQVGK